MGCALGDIIVAPNIPVWGVVSIFWLVGLHEYSLDAPRQWDERFGHVLPAELLVAAIDRRSPRVSDGPARCFGRRPGLYNISGKRW